jgi:hypothetical protein
VSAIDSDGSASSSVSQFGADSETSTTKEDNDSHDSYSDDHGGLDEEEDETIDRMDIT